MLTFVKKPPVVSLCENPMIFQVATNLSSAYENIIVYVEPYYSDGNILTGKDMIYLEPGGTGLIDLSEYLGSGLQKTRNFVFPEQGNVSWLSRENLVKQYKVRFNECSGWDNPACTSWWIENRYVVKGKIPKWKKAAFYARWTSFLDWVTTDMAFLSFSPKTLVTAPDVIQKLYFLVYWSPQATSRLSLKIDLIFTDGSTAVFVPSQTTGLLSSFQVIEFSVGYTVLGLSNEISSKHPGKILDYYEVTVMEGETIRSETRRYEMDYAFHAGAHQFFFACSPGGYDTFRTTGEAQLNSEFEITSVSQQSPGHLSLPEKKTAFVKSTDVITAKSGYISAEFAEYIAEMFESTEAYEVMSYGLVPVVFHNVKLMRKHDNSNLYSFEFEYEHSIIQFVEIG